MVTTSARITPRRDGTTLADDAEAIAMRPATGTDDLKPTMYWAVAGWPPAAAGAPPVASISASATPAIGSPPLIYRLYSRISVASTPSATITRRSTLG